MDSQLSKVDISESKARLEFTSDVFWERIVAMSTSMGSLLGRHSRGPYSCSRYSMTFSIIICLIYGRILLELIIIVLYKYSVKKGKVIEIVMGGGWTRVVTRVLPFERGRWAAINKYS